MFRNQVAFITGASSGLGRALAIALSQQGAKLSLMSRDMEALKLTASLCMQNENAPLLYKGDVTDTQHCQQAIGLTETHYGQIDHVILNAGISMWSSFADLPNLDIIKQTVATNYLGAVNCTYYALPHLKKSRGLITVISSVQAKTGTPFHSGYAASKHALHGFYDSLRMELNHAVDILMVCPSWIRDTNLKERAATNKEPDLTILGKHKKSSLDLDYCVRQILLAMRRRQRELTLPKHYRFIPLFRMLFPALLDKIVMAKSS